MRSRGMQAALSQDTVTVSEDGMRAWGTVPMRAQDATLGTTSGQLFRNSTWVCTPAAPPEPGHAVRPDTTLRPAESCQFAANEVRPPPMAPAWWPCRGGGCACGCAGVGLCRVALLCADCRRACSVLTCVWVLAVARESEALFLSCSLPASPTLP